MYCNGKGNEEEEGIDDAENLPWSTVGYQRLLSCLSDGTYNRAIDDGSEAPSTISQLEEDDGGSVPPPRLVLVYLHSPIHRHTRPFVRDVLLNPRLSSFAAEQSLILWGGDVSRSAEANALAHSLGISTFPALAIVGCPVVQDYIQQNSNTNTTSRGHKSEILYLRSGYPDGSSPAQTLARVLSDVGSASRRHHRATSEALRVRRERSEASRLRVEQDGEYRAALEADRRREEERAAQLEVEAAAKTAAREAEAEAEREQEEAKAAQRAKRNDARVRLREEPGVGEGGTCRVRITMPCGARIDRRFYENDTVQSIRDFLTVSWEDAEKEADMIELLTTPTSRGRKKVPQRIENFSMSTNFPKRILDSNEMTLLGAGLVPQAVIMLQDLDA